MLLEGIFAAVPTPFYPDERIYFRKLEANVARYSRSLLAGMVVLGSTGEAPALNDAESRDVLRTAAESASPEKVLIAGVGRESVSSTVEMAEAAAALKYDAVLVRTPTYYANQMTTAAVLHHFRSVADRSPLPVVLYHIPKFVPYDFPIEVVAELAQHPNIVGIKDSSGSLQRIQAMVESTNTAPRRTVTVTPVFEAVTARMLTPRIEAEGSFVAVSELGSGAAVAAPPPVPPSRHAPKRSVSRCSPARPPFSSNRSRPARRAQYWASLPAPRRPARRSTLPGRITTRSSPGKSRNASPHPVSA